MKKAIRFLFFCFLLIIVFSCLSDPEAKYSEANTLREKVNKYKLGEYAEEEYNAAEENLKEGKSLIDANNKFKASKVLDISTQNYKMVLDKGLPPYTESQNEEAKENKSEAEAIKANVAVKNKYEEAEKLYNEAMQSMNSKDYEKAIALFNEAEEKYKDASGEAMVKRDRTKKSIDSTEEVKRKVEENVANLSEESEDELGEVE